jgi:ribokinase
MTRPAVILTVGSLHYDIMVEADHLPARDETAVGSRWYPKSGGKGGNQAVSVSRQGMKSRLCGAVGDDAFGQYLRESLRTAGVDDRFVATVAGVGSGISVAVQDRAGDYAATIVSGANLALDPAGLCDDALWDGVGMLLLQNEVPDAINIAAATEARRRGVRTMLNAAPARTLPPSLPALVSVLVVNAVEAEMMGAGHVCCLQSAAQATGLLAARFDAVVVTAGARGLAAHDSDDTTLLLPAEKVTVVSAHGAGDAFTGALAVALVQGHDLATGCRMASHAAALHVAGQTATPALV